MTTRSRVKKLVDDGFVDEGLLSLADDVDKYGDLKSLAEQPGGKVLRATLRDDIIQAINKLTTNYTTMTHLDMIAIVAHIDARLTLLRILTNAKENFEALDQELKDTLG